VEGPLFSAIVALVFGAFSWLQFPALCGFMFSSTRAGAGNFRYSLILGSLLAVVGLLSALHAWTRGSPRTLAAAAMALNLAFIAASLAAPGWFDASCHALYVDVTGE
jgi:hypothetical protein